eukprot:12652718-Heterocapsa_arctica.AAC.1
MRQPPSSTSACARMSRLTSGGSQQSGPPGSSFPLHCTSGSPMQTSSTPIPTAGLAVPTSSRSFGTWRTGTQIAGEWRPWS